MAANQSIFSDVSHSLAPQERSKRPITGMVQLLSKRPGVYLLWVWTFYYQKAKGTRIWDVDDNEYLDMSIGDMTPCSHFVFVHEEHLAMNAYFIQLMMERGFLASSQFYAIHAHQDTHVVACLETADQAFVVVAEAVSADNLVSRLKDAPSRAGFKRVS